MSAPDVSMPSADDATAPAVTDQPTPAMPSPTVGSTDDLEAQGLASHTMPAPPDTSQTPAPQQPKQSLWRGVLAGALQGLAAGSAVNTKGMGGAAGFAAGAGAGANQVLNVHPQQQAEMDQAKATTALHYINLAKAQKELNSMDDDQRDKNLRQAAEQSQAMFKSGAVVPLSDASSDPKVAQQKVQDLHNKNPWAVYSIAPTVGADGDIQYSAVQFTKGPTQADVTLPGANPDGSDMVIKAGTMTGEQIGKMQSQMWDKKFQQQSKVSMEKQKESGRSDLEDQKQSGRVDIQNLKNAGAAARAKANNSDLWVPKVTADEKKKAELSENIAFNANEVAKIIMKRPDLIGAVSGRYTNVQQMVGNNDPDISALGTHIHNIAMANSGVHGFRNREGVTDNEKLLLNNFKNGPKAVAGALKASVGSVQTFIDAARPEKYKTHSSQGGALRGMTGAQ